MTITNPDPAFDAPIVLPATRRRLPNGHWTTGLIESMQGREGVAYNAEILFDGKRVGWYSDDGNGGMARFDPVEGNMHNGPIAVAWREFNEATLALDPDGWIDGGLALVAEDELATQLRRGRKLRAVPDPGDGNPLPDDAELYVFRQGATPEAIWAKYPDYLVWVDGAWKAAS